VLKRKIDGNRPFADLEKLMFGVILGREVVLALEDNKE
jgi:hypothetical protein